MHARATLYAREAQIGICGQLGFGIDGIVFETDRRSALKVFERERGYLMERDVYLRLTEHAVSQIQRPQREWAQLRTVDESDVS